MTWSTYSVEFNLWVQVEEQVEYSTVQKTVSIFVLPLLEVAQTDWMNAVSIVYIFFYITYLLLNHHYHHQRRRNVRYSCRRSMLRKDHRSSFSLCVSPPPLTALLLVNSRDMKESKDYKKQRTEPQAIWRCSFVPSFWINIDSIHVASACCSFLPPSFHCMLIFLVP